MMNFVSGSKLVTGVATLAILLSACSGDGDAGQGGPGPGGFGGFGGGGATIPAVEAVMARYGTLPLEERLTGRVIARNQTEIYPEVGGPITRVFVENGDYVNAGDSLVQLRDSEYIERHQQSISGLAIAEAQTRQAQASLDLAEAQLARVASVVERGLDTSSALDTARSERDIAKANLDLRVAQENQARSLVEEQLLQLENTTVRAPISGTVGQRGAEIGQLATTTSRLFIIGDLSEMRVEVLLSERMMNYIDEGVAVNIFSDSWDDTVLSDSIDRISPFLDPATMRTEAFIEMDNANNLLRPGMFVTVDILYGESDRAVLIPNSALYHHPRTGLEGVYVMSQPDDASARDLQEEGEGIGIIAAPQPVRFVSVDVIASGRMATAVNGVNEGDWVITVGQNLLEGGIEEARPRLLPWNYMMELQEMQNEDMFEIIEQTRQALSNS